MEKKDYKDSIVTIAKELYLNGLADNMEDAMKIAEKWVISAETELYWS